MARSILPTLFACLLLSSGCADDTSSSAAPALDELQRRPGYVIDSIRPMAEELRIFRAAAGPAPDALTGAARTREALVARFMSSLAAGDSGSLAALHLDPAEFAWFYFPDSKFSKPPYELPPGLLWRQVTAESNKAVGAALRILGGPHVEYLGHACDPVPDDWGAGRLWGNCRVTWRVETTGDTSTAQLFGSILERDGLFKFVSYASEL